MNTQPPIAIKAIRKQASRQFNREANKAIKVAIAGMRRSLEAWPAPVGKVVKP